MIPYIQRQMSARDLFRYNSRLTLTPEKLEDYECKTRSRA